MQVIKIINPGFSTADAEGLHFEYADQKLRLLFTDWQEQSIEVILNEVVSFRLESVPVLYEHERDDSSYEVLDSEWVEDHRKAGEIEHPSEYSHYRFNFNAIGQLEALAKCYVVKT